MRRKLAVRRSKNRQTQKKSAPGRDFEKLVEDLVREGGFVVRPNAGAARPRQTDLYAHSPNLDILIEAKDRKRKVDIADIDNLRARLRRTAGDVVGAIFTTSEITRGAIREIEGDRTREILVFLNGEIEYLRHDPTRLKFFIARKREKLRVDGKADVGLPDRELLGVKLPSTGLAFKIAGETAPYFLARKTFAHATYALNFPDPGWGSAGGYGVVLPLRLTIDKIDELRDILGYIHDRFGLSANGSFSIHQSDSCWHGVGAQTLLRTIAQWKERYAAGELERIHHSEDIHYVDHFRGGRIILSTRQRVNIKDNAGRSRRSFFHTSDLAIQLRGVPVNLAPFIDLCRYIGDELAEFEPIEMPIAPVLRLKKGIRLKVMGTVVDKRAEWRGGPRLVRGIIARNPFFGKRSLPAELNVNHESSLQDLLRIELILCDLQDWHDEGDVIDHYVLRGVETTFAQGAHLIRPFGTWHQIIKHAVDRSESTSVSLKTLEELARKLP